MAIRQIKCHLCGQAVLVGRSDAIYCGQGCSRMASYARTRGLTVLRGTKVVVGSLISE
jgi:hypothetical protein